MYKQVDHVNFLWDFRGEDGKHYTGICSIGQARFMVKRGFGGHGLIKCKFNDRSNKNLTMLHSITVNPLTP